MAIYIDPAMVPDLDNIDSRVFKYLIQKHKGQLARWAKCKDYYEGRHDILAHKVDDDDDVVRFNVNYTLLHWTCGHHPSAESWIKRFSLCQRQNRV